MPALASSDLTVTVLESRVITNRQRENLVRVTFGDSSKTYPSGGITLPSAATFGFRSPLRFLVPVQDRNLTSLTQWRHDYASGTLRGYQYGLVPPVVLSEVVSLTGNTTGTLKYPPAYIFTCQGSGNAALKPIPVGITPATTQVAVNFLTGAITCLAADSLTSATFSYIPQQPSGPFALANMVIDEVVALTTGSVNLANRAACFQYIYRTTATAALLGLQHVNASGAVALDIQNSGNSTLSVNANENATSAKCTYLKYAGFVNNVSTTWIDQASIALSSQIKEWGKTAGDLVGGLMIPAMGPQIIDLQAAVYVTSFLVDSSGTAAANKAKFEVAKQKITTAETTAATTIEDTAFLFLSPYTQPNAALAELTVNDAPSATTLYFIAVN